MKSLMINFCTDYGISVQYKKLIFVKYAVYIDSVHSLRMAEESKQMI